MSENLTDSTSSWTCMLFQIGILELNEKLSL